MTRVQAFRFLTQCLEGGDRSALAAAIASDRLQWEAVIAMASEYWMTLTLHHELEAKGVLELLPAELLEYFASLREANAARNRAILEHASELAGLLNRIGVEPVLLKGTAHLASGLYPDIAIRFMSDIDILVPDDRALECWRLLIAAGYQTSSANAGLRVEDMPDVEWPALLRHGRTGEVEMHRRQEWDHLLNAPSLYAGTEPLALPGGTARILSPVNRIVFTLAHACVQHRRKYLPVISLRDLYDANLLARRLESRIDWRQVTDAFDREGETGALRTGCTMSRRLLAGNLPGGARGPVWSWFYWQLCLLTIRNPRRCDQAAYHGERLQLALSRTAEGSQLRRKFANPAVLFQTLRNAARTYADRRPSEKQR